jgi:hypothetical protein
VSGPGVVDGVSIEPLVVVVFEAAWDSGPERDPVLLARVLAGLHRL